MKKILLFCFTIYVWAYTCFSFFAHYLLFSCTRFFVKDKRSWSFFLTKLFVVPAFKVLAFPLHVHGLENVYTEKNFIVASNHQSLLDIIVFMATLRRPFSFFAKEELLKVPVLGSDIRNQGHFVVDRKNPRRAVKQMMDARKKMEGGYSLLIFPEGTRSIDDTIAPFKRGAFLLASQTGTPIIPTYLTGTGRAMNKKRFLEIGRAHV